MEKVTTDLPFKVGDRRIVIVKEIPAYQCVSCPEYVLEDDVMSAVDRLLENTDAAAELEIVRYAA